VSAAQRPFQQFLDEHRDAVWRFVVAAVGRDRADDCFQETFLAALRAYPKLRSGSNERAWLLTIAHHKAIDMHRQSARAPLPVETLPEPEPRAVTAVDQTLDGAIWGDVRALPPRQRAAVLLRFVADLPHREVAAALGCSEEAARRSLHEGITKLREAYLK
jgi:RNA polymerase sigma factor (sigma-70 family)